MSRKGQSPPRKIQPDLIYHHPLVSRLINYSMKNGKKKAAEKQIYQALDLIKKDQKADDVTVILDQALENIRPKVEVRPRRIGGAVYQVPTPVRGNRQNSLAIRWLVTSARKKTNKEFHTFGQKISSELLLALKNEGSAVAKRLEVEKMAEANKAFAHLRW